MSDAEQQWIAKYRAALDAQPLPKSRPLFQFLKAKVEILLGDCLHSRRYIAPESVVSTLATWHGPEETRLKKHAVSEPSLASTLTENVKQAG